MGRNYEGSKLNHLLRITLDGALTEIILNVSVTVKMLRSKRKHTLNFQFTVNLKDFYVARRKHFCLFSLMTLELFD
jgi:hypothetical protein